MRALPFFRKIAFLALLLFLCSGTHAASIGDKTLDGVWEGDLPYTEATFPLPSVLGMHLEIAGKTAKITTTSRGGTITQVKPGRLAVARYMTNAVILSIDAGKDDDGTWVETWLVTVTAKDSDTLIARWTRVVNNTALAPDAPSSKFVVAGGGELVRVQKR